MRVKWVCHDTLHLGRNVRRRQGSATEVEQAKPAGGYACKEEVRRLWQETHRRDRFGRCMLLEDAGIYTGPEVSTRYLWLRAAYARSWLNLDMVVDIWVQLYVLMRVLCDGEDGRRGGDVPDEKTAFPADFVESDCEVVRVDTAECE